MLITFDKAINNENTCKICLISLADHKENNDEIVWLDSCKDRFHSRCFIQYLKTQIENSAFPLKCPIPTCKVILTRPDIADHLTFDEIERFDRFENKWVQSVTPDATECPNPRCNNIFVRDSRDFRFSCSKCQQTWCLRCKAPWHIQMTCEEY